MNDSIWATVFGVAKMFGMSEKQALYDISYKNAVMYSRTIPMPDDMVEYEESPLYDGSKDANDPENFNNFDNFENEEVVRT